MSLLDELSTAAGRAAEAAGGAVVRIGRAQGRGAGVVVAPGVIVTSAHNVRGDESTVTFSDGRSVTATVKGIDADGDLAVLAADTATASPVAWSDSSGEDGPAVGAPVFAVALPSGGGVRVTFGLVSSRDRSFRGPRGRLITDAVEHTAPLGRGSSGGPLLDAEGNLVGINTHRPGDGLYLALPATSTLRSRASMRWLEVRRPAGAVSGSALAPGHVARRLRAAVGLEPRDGVLVREVAEGSPAAVGGLLRGDLIVAAGGQPVDSVDSLLAAVDGVGDDGALTLTIVRGVEESQVTVRFGVER